MKIRIIGGGWYGCHLAAAFSEDHEVELHESAGQLFSGASGVNPARLHQGWHYPRSAITRAACREHNKQFLDEYAFLTRPIATNIYAVAAEESLVDFDNYMHSLRSEAPCIPILCPAEYGLANVEGAVLTGERHIVIDKAREYFEDALGDAVKYFTSAGEVDSPDFDLNIDCTFCAFDAEAIDRYEPCVVGYVWGPTNRAVTIMDGPFPSIYPWREEDRLSSITSARLTPLSKEIRTYAEAADMLKSTPHDEIAERGHQMLDDMERFWPAVRKHYKLAAVQTAIRAMPKSGADARLVDVISVGERSLRVRAGKIDAIFRAEALIREMTGI